MVVRAWQAVPCRQWSSTHAWQAGLGSDWNIVTRLLDIGNKCYRIIIRTLGERRSAVEDHLLINMLSYIR